MRNFILGADWSSDCDDVKAKPKGILLRGSIRLPKEKAIIGTRRNKTYILIMRMG